jgi:hypothetical protein
MHLAIDTNGVFHFTGGADIAPVAQPTDAPTVRVRSTLTVADDRTSVITRWERSDDETNWSAWMDIHFTPIEDAPAAASDATEPQ